MPNIHPSVWGPPTWDMMEYVLKGYDVTPERPVEHLTGFLRSLVHLLPCERCRVHWVQVLATDPPEPHMDTVEQRLAWLARVRAKARPTPAAAPAAAAGPDATMVIGGAVLIVAVLGALAAFIAFARR